MAWDTNSLGEHMETMAKFWRTNGISAKGKEDLIGHFEGRRLTKQEAISAHCYECMGGHSDGLSRDCENPPCPLYPHMPFNPNRVKRDVSEEQRKVLIEASRKSRRTSQAQAKKA